jgi:hypothetical protein
MYPVLLLVIPTSTAATCNIITTSVRFTGNSDDRSHPVSYVSAWVIKVDNMLPAIKKPYIRNEPHYDT